MAISAHKDLPLLQPLSAPSTATASMVWKLLVQLELILMQPAPNEQQTAFPVLQDSTVQLEIKTQSNVLPVKHALRVFLVSLKL